MNHLTSLPLELATDSSSLSLKLAYDANSKMRAPKDPPCQILIMAERKVESLSVLGHEVREFQEQLSAEVSNTCSNHGCFLFCFTCIYV